MDTRRGKERVMRQCSCGHYNHIRKNNCEHCNMAKPPPRKREKRPRRKRRPYMSPTNMNAFSQAFSAPFGAHGLTQGAHFIQGHGQSANTSMMAEQLHVQHGQTQPQLPYGQSPMTEYLPQLPMHVQHGTQHETQHQIAGIGRLPGHSDLLHGRDSSSNFRKHLTEHPSVIDESGISGFSAAHTAHSLGVGGRAGGTGEANTFVRDAIGVGNSGYTRPHEAGAIRSGGNVLGIGISTVAHEGHDMVSPSQVESELQSVGGGHGERLFHRMNAQSISIEDERRRLIDDNLRASRGLGQNVLSSRPGDSGHVSMRDSPSRALLNIRSGGLHNHSHDQNYGHEIAQRQRDNRLEFATHGHSVEDRRLGAREPFGDSHAFYQTNPLGGVSGQAKLDAGNVGDDTRGEAKTSQHDVRHDE